MRVLHVLGDRVLPPNPDNAPMSGVVRAALEIGREQAAMGMHVHVVAVGESRWKATWNGVALRSLRRASFAQLPRVVDYRVHAPLMAIAANRRFDVVHGHLYSYLRFLRARLRVIHHHADPVYARATLRDAARMRHDAGLHVAVSEYVGRRVRELIGEPCEVLVAHNGSEHATRDLDPGPLRSAGRKQLGLSDDDAVFLFAGAIRPKKGIGTLLASFRALALDDRRVVLLIAGGETLWGAANDRRGTRFEDELRVSNDDCLAGRVRWLGKLAPDEMAVAYASCDSVVVPSVVPEAFGLVAIEGMAFGNHIIASRTGGLAEVVGEGVGALVEPSDTGALTQAMRKFVRNISYWRQRRSTVAQTVTKYSWRRSAREISDAYRRLLQEKNVTTVDNA